MSQIPDNDFNNALIIDGSYNQIRNYGIYKPWFSSSKGYQRCSFLWIIPRIIITYNIIFYREIINLETEFLNYHDSQNFHWEISHDLRIIILLISRIITNRSKKGINEKDTIWKWIAGSLDHDNFIKVQNKINDLVQKKNGSAVDQRTSRESAFSFAESWTRFSLLFSAKVVKNREKEESADDLNRRGKK